VRNVYYHEGEYDEIDSEIAIHLYYRLIRARFPDWKTARGMFSYGRSHWDAQREESVTFSADQRIEWGFESSLSHSDPFSDEYWTKGIDYLLSYQSNRDLRDLIGGKLDELLDEIEERINFIKADGRNLDWNHVLCDRSILTGWFCFNIENGRPITDLNAVLNIYMVINRHGEELLDIGDPKTRNEKFFEYLNAHAFDCDVLSAERFAKYRRLAKSVRSETAAKAISSYLDAEKELRDLSAALKTCAFDLDGWIQLQIDIARGK
jgi:hypothetical protein